MYFIAQERISGGNNKFQWLVLSELCTEIVPEVIRKNGEYYADFKILLTKMIDYLCLESWVNTEASTKQKFCWEILAICCSKFKIAGDDLNWTLHYHVIEDLHLEKVFRNYCNKKQLVPEHRILAASSLPTDIKSLPMTTCRYVPGMGIGGPLTQYAWPPAKSLQATSFSFFESLHGCVAWL